ncbi:hypothetical protein DPMN_132853 [Dreissena polymorpha]|uniref:Uncharacterized protein n=1 Tax=Dreissena polymorpha TaxID=45954 RepID=A0A9D4FWW1_DREPO|nr:hypothetical protein DPMN_132853 [Dreissena polymorpha]
MPMAVENMVATCSPTKDLTSVAQDTSVVGDCSSTLEVSAHSALQTEKSPLSEGGCGSFEDRSHQVQWADAHIMTYSLRDVLKPIRMVQVENLEHPVGILKRRFPL